MPGPLPLPSVVPVAGVSFRQEVVGSVTEGDPVRIVPEPDNPFDASAHQVLVAGRHVGYVPSGLVERLAAHGAHAYTGQVTEVLHGETRGLRVRIEGAADTSECTPDIDGAPPAPTVALS